MLGSSICVVASRFSYTATAWITRPLNRHIKRFYSVHMFKANARLDVPTFDDPAVLQQLDQASPLSYDRTVAFNVISSFVQLFCVAVELFTSMLVLYRVLLQQQDGLLLILPSFIVMFLEYSSIFTSTHNELSAPSFPFLQSVNLLTAYSLGSDDKEQRLCALRRPEGPYIRSCSPKGNRSVWLSPTCHKPCVLSYLLVVVFSLESSLPTNCATDAPKCRPLQA